MRKLFREAENTSGQGALWPKLAGCVLALMLLASTAIANPQLDLTNPTGFFTNVAMALFQQMDLHDFNGNLVTITNIPIYEDPTRFGGTNINYYTPAVHRILQLAANIFDAATNRFIDGGPTNYPTVFRPMFRSQDGVVYIDGYLEVTNSQDAFNFYVDPQPFSTVDNPIRNNINMYGIPWVIGVKKGFPNFNEISMDNSLAVSRKLQFTNAIGRPPWITNQVYDLSITNSYGVEFWNSYTNLYGRPLRLIVTNEVSVVVSNDFGVPFLSASNRVFGNDVTFPSWPGWTMQQSDSSMQVPLLATEVYTNGIYLNQSPWVVPLAPPQWDATAVPPLWMGLQFRFRAWLIDTSVNRIVDFVNIVDNQPPVNVSAVLSQDATDTIDLTLANQWSTKPYGGQNGDALIGIMNQIFASQGFGGTISDWRDSPNTIQAEETHFRTWLNNGGTNSFQAPYTPRRTVSQRISLQANDPLVHYTLDDLTSTNGAMANFNRVDVIPLTTTLNNLTNLNLAYQPWGGSHTPGGPQLNPNPQFDYNWQVKDPGIQQSDNWNFPTGESLGFEWLGRVHRGTPWQTIYLKPANIPANQWRAWNNDKEFITNGAIVTVDAALNHPTNDWHIASLWAQWVNTNDLSTFLSINNPDTNAWTARLDGLTALTNSAFDELDPVTITSNSPQAGIIAQTIQTTRANTNPANGPVFPNHGFQQIGDVLATPQLSVASPFINTNAWSSLTANGITDEALEKIPAQLLPLLRVDSFGQIAPVNGQLELSFSGYDGHAYAIEASSNLTDWVIIRTNCPTDGNFGITNTATSGQRFYRSVLLH